MEKLEIELRAQLMAQQVALGLLFAAAANGRADVVNRMHEALQGLITDAVRNAGARQPDMPAAMGAMMEAIAGQHVDAIFSMASQVK